MMNVGFAAITFLVILKLITEIHGDKHYFDERLLVVAVEVEKISTEAEPSRRVSLPKK